MKYEIYMHLTCITFFTLTSVVGGIFNFYNEVEISQGSWVANYPDNCELDDSCWSQYIGLLYAGIPTVFAFSSIVINNIQVYRHVKYHLSDSGNDNTEAKPTTDAASSVASFDSSIDPTVMTSKSSLMSSKGGKRSGPKSMWNRMTGRFRWRKDKSEQQENQARCGDKKRTSDATAGTAEALPMISNKIIDDQQQDHERRRRRDEDQKGEEQKQQITPSYEGSSIGGYRSDSSLLGSIGDIIEDAIIGDDSNSSDDDQLRSLSLFSSSSASSRMSSASPSLSLLEETKRKRREMQSKKQRQHQQQQRRNSSGSASTTSSSSSTIHNNTILQQERTRLKNAHIQEVAAQGLLYVFSFLIAYTAGGILRILEVFDFTAESEGRLYTIIVIDAFLKPLQGLFNALIYNRPAYIRFRNAHPELSIFWAIRKSCFDSNIPKLTTAKMRSGGSNTMWTKTSNGSGNGSFRRRGSGRFGGIFGGKKNNTGTTGVAEAGAGVGNANGAKRSSGTSSRSRKPTFSSNLAIVPEVSQEEDEDRIYDNKQDTFRNQQEYEAAMGISGGGGRQRGRRNNGSHEEQQQQQQPLYSMSSEEYLTSRMSGWDDDDEDYDENEDASGHHQQLYDPEGYHQRLVDEEMPVVSSSTTSSFNQSRILLVNERWSARISSITKDDEEDEEEFSDEDSVSFDDNQDGFQINDMMMGVINNKKSSTFLSSTSIDDEVVDGVDDGNPNSRSHDDMLIRMNNLSSSSGSSLSSTRNEEDDEILFDEPEDEEEPTIDQDYEDDEERYLQWRQQNEEQEKKRVECSQMQQEDSLHQEDVVASVTPFTKNHDPSKGVPQSSLSSSSSSSGMRIGMDGSITQFTTETAAATIAEYTSSQSSESSSSFELLDDGSSNC